MGSLTSAGPEGRIGWADIRALSANRLEGELDLWLTEEAARRLESVKEGAKGILIQHADRTVYRLSLGDELPRAIELVTARSGLSVP